MSHMLSTQEAEEGESLHLEVSLGNIERSCLKNIF